MNALDPNTAAAGMGAAALAYAGKGVPVFPCGPEKKPLTPQGFHDSSTDPAIVAEWWKRWPNALIGMPTGAISGVWVLDIDDPEAFAAKAPPLPKTRKAITGKGFHLHFQHQGGEMRNAQRHPNRGWPFPDLPGAEVRGDGGYVILPPSRHPSGRCYEWAETCEPCAAPENLLRLMRRNADSRGVASPPLPCLGGEQQASLGGNDSPYGLKALEGEVEAILRAGNGEQESALNDAALKMGALVAGGELSRTTARAALIRAGQSMPSHDPCHPWTPDAIEKKVERGLADGEKSPRSAPEQNKKDDPAKKQPAAEAEGKAIPVLDLVALARVTPQPKRFVIPDLMPAGEVTLLSGPGSAGKSLWTQQVLTAFAAGVATLGLNMGRGAAAYLTCEDDPQELHWRQANICRALGVEMPRLDGALHLASLRGKSGNDLGTFDREGRFRESPFWTTLAEFIHGKQVEIMAIDNLSHLFTGNENDRGQVTQFLTALNRIAGESGAAILLLGHTNKGYTRGHETGNAHSGSTAWVNAVRSQIVLKHDEATDVRTIHSMKSNYAKKGEKMRFYWENGAFILESDADPLGVKEMVNAKIEDIFLRCLDLCTKNRQSVSHKTGKNYAPAVFSKMPEAERRNSQDLAAAMGRLLGSGRIEQDCELWKDQNRRTRRGLRIAGQTFEAVEADHAEDPADH